MNDFVNNVLAELQNNQRIKNNPLVQLVVESANVSIRNNESNELVYSQIKRGLSSINEKINSSEVSSILSKFDKFEDTSESKVYRLSKIGNLSQKLDSIKESNAYSNPIIADKVNRYNAELGSGKAEFMLYPRFINDFGSHVIEESVKSAVESISSIINENTGKLEMLNTIYLMENMNSPLYKSTCEDLKNMLVNESYTSDIINLKYGKTDLPLIKSLVNTLKMVESRDSGTFTMGAGNSDTLVENMVCPAIKSAKKSILTYMDGRFIRVTESEKLNGSELEVNVKGNGFSISTIDPNWVKEKHTSFYNVCESYAKLGFKPSENKSGVESSNISKFNIGLIVNEDLNLDLYINDKKIDSAKDANISEALVMVDDETKGHVKRVLENTNTILNLEFIKNVSNDRTLAESIVFKLNESYFICDKLNSAERSWSQVNEHKMYEHFMSKFNYDISPIFGSKINESIELDKKIEARKSEILKNIEKLEGSIAKLSEAAQSKDIDPINLSNLDTLKSSLVESVENLRDEYVKLDLGKKSLNEKKAKPDYLDLDGDGDKEEPMKKAAEDKKKKKSSK
jgi:hypothetical protein